jgi:hypothetical protein
MPPKGSGKPKGKRKSRGNSAKMRSASGPMAAAMTMHRRRSASGPMAAMPLHRLPPLPMGTGLGWR